MVKEFINIRDIPVGEYEKYFLLMTDSKQKRVERFRFEDGKKRTVFGEMLARKMICRNCNIGEEKIVFKTSGTGKPYTKNADICFNISHSDELVLCALNDTPVGVDIEKVRDINPMVIKHTCNEDELEYVYENGISKRETLKRFFEIWTFKEACFKYKGTGIDDFQSLDFFNCNRQMEHGFFGDYAYCIIY
ncbi:MAG: 4'-phosphopantetheinyl transferase superfamily protein [Clostridiales bacterium]|nr:4'-phosphopantetheinyl transferase superfamily protein [Clostridiales bacterium]